jgi:ABC-2 type transport system ATP-binding protein
VRVRLSRPADTAGLADVPGVADLRTTDGLIEMSVSGPMGPLVEALGGLPIETLDSQEPELDELFLSYYGSTHAS